MSEQKKKAAPETEKVETPKIPHVAYPLKPRSNTTNLSQQYFNHLAGDESARFLFNNSGLWHQGIHLRASKFPSSEFENNKICAIADGKLVAYKVDREYKTDAKSESSKASAVYSTGFFLLKHEVAYPKDNVLTFYSLYRHTAKLSDYKSGIEELVGITKSADNKIVIRDAKNQPLNPRVELKNGVTIGVRRNTKGQEQFDELLWYRETKDNKTVEHKPKSGEHWRIFNQSYEEMQNEKIKGLPLLSKRKIDTQVDVEVKLDKPIEIKAGETLGLMGEYNQIGESGEKLLHLEVFTYDDISQFTAKAKAAYLKDKEKKGIKDNFLYVARGSQLYSITNGEVIELEKSKVEIMVPLADVAKQTVKKKTDKVGKDYYNVQPYLYSLPQKNKEGGIYVDSSHLTHGLLFPGVNVFSQAGNGLCIFKHGLHQNIDPKSNLSVEQKNELDPVFKSIMNELSLDKDKNKPVVFEAGKLKDLLLTSVQQRRLTGIVVKHDSEWKKTRTADFSQTCGVYRANGKEDTAKRIEKRVEDLSIKLEVDGFNTDKQAYYLHPLGMIGWLMPYSTCFCHRDFTVDEVKNIIKLMRDSEKNNNYKIFFAKNCPLSESDKTYERLTEEINKTFRKYEINTCLRKVHFLAQMYLETDRLKTTVEYASGEQYNPGRHKDAIKNKNTEVGDGPRYKGRGGMQLTWRVNYLRYFEHTRKDVAYYSKVISPTETLLSMSDRRKNFNTLVGESLFLAIDSAGWYWRNGSAWGDLNSKADNDDVYSINIGVNGGFNDFKPRITWVKSLIRDNNIQECPNLNLSKPIGEYKFSTSGIKNTKYGKGLQKKFEGYDD
ncbi:glycoside hydrolase family 19 protein [Haemophilus parainfluenzae]|jgi:glycoside hydrolase, family 19, putative|uniref:glycoside hydrolase family 19 protein n=1 Tax=Haemophilus parainfluenzae TaxID=729 RepID=UPI000B22F332|nr:glycoside hydrolase family 19 [Haemophilus parainfluenzae]